MNPKFELPPPAQWCGDDTELETLTGQFLVDDALNGGHAEPAEEWMPGTGGYEVEATCVGPH